MRGPTIASPIAGEWLAGMRRSLSAMRAQLLAEDAAEARELATPPDERGDDTTPSQHPADIASDLERREFVLTRWLIDVRELGQIEAAIERIDAGTYGMCVDCGAPIPRERLEVRPHAARDVGCERLRARRRATGP